MSITTRTSRRLAASIVVVSVLSIAGCGSSAKAPSADAPAGNEVPASSNAASSAGAKGAGGTTAKTKHTVHEEVLAARQAVITMTKCVEGHGVKVPPQKLYAAKPVFSMKGINTATPQFRAAYNICLPKAYGVYKSKLQNHE